MQGVGAQCMPCLRLSSASILPRAADPTAGHLQSDSPTASHTALDVVIQLLLQLPLIMTSALVRSFPQCSVPLSHQKVNRHAKSFSSPPANPSPHHQQHAVPPVTAFGTCMCQQFGSLPQLHRFLHQEGQAPAPAHCCCRCCTRPCCCSRRCWLANRGPFQLLCCCRHMCVCCLRRCTVLASWSARLLGACSCRSCRGSSCCCWACRLPLLPACSSSRCCC